MSSTAVVPASQAATSTAAGRTSLSSSLATLPAIGSTPKKTSAPAAAAITPTKRPGEGGWIHPRMDEVLRRRNATNFEPRNAKNILVCVGILLLSLWTPNAMRAVLPTPWLNAVSPFHHYFLWILRLFLALGALASAMPLLRTPDACEDIPLTPQQRKLLGLPPMSRPATPQEQEQYLTPPRFSRSGTPRSSTSSIRAEASDSPSSGRGTPFTSSAFHSPGSATLQRASSGSPSLRSGDERRRLSFTGQRGSPLSESLWDSSGSTLGSGTPSKVGNNRASIGLNNKWLYEKGRGSPSAGLKASRGPSFVW